MRLAELWRYPVKSLRGERLRQVVLADGGIPGDRSLHVVDGDGRLLTARTRHAMLGLEATWHENGIRIAGEPWRSEAAARALREVAGDDARLVQSEGGHRFDDTAILVATDGAVAWTGVDGRRFRPNLLIEGVDGLDERSWPGSRLRIGDAVLDVRWICKRCLIPTLDPDTQEVDPEVLRRIDRGLEGLFALNCEVKRPGGVAVGDEVELVRGAASTTGGRTPGKVAVLAADGP